MLRLKKKISSTSLLTNDTTGKGVISLGDSIDKVKQIPSDYELIDSSFKIEEDYQNEYGENFWFGDVNYDFDAKGKLDSIGSSSGFGSFETSKGLKNRRPYFKNVQTIWQKLHIQ